MSLRSSSSSPSSSSVSFFSSSRNAETLLGFVVSLPEFLSNNNSLSPSAESLLVLFSFVKRDFSCADVQEDIEVFTSGVAPALPLEVLVSSFCCPAVCLPKTSAASFVSLWPSSERNFEESVEQTLLSEETTDEEEAIHLDDFFLRTLPPTMLPIVRLFFRLVFEETLDESSAASDLRLLSSSDAGRGRAICSCSEFSASFFSEAWPAIELSIDTSS
mmetsp:Transcript_8618/g.20581  ORF Transcript_8618/g.20581 Transcript_8618/m.20581 type:complete len:217 (+) Transcript_8618:278-928(+)